jgi:nucleotide-binding universal stress UspA family protein
MLRDILVHIPSERSIASIVDAAVSLAADHKAHLDAVSIGFEYTNLDLAPDGGTEAAALLEIEQERARARAKAALAVFEAEARNARVSYGLKPLTGVPAEAASAVSALARLYELTIVLQPQPGQDTSYNIVSQEILFQSGGPVLLIPYTHKGPIGFDQVGLAWDGSRLAARALRDAAPFLARAQAITIISVDNSDMPEDVSAAALLAHLTTRGVKARIERLKADRVDIQPTILSVAADTGLDLIVMGGYGHSRLNERILGGVTRDMLQAMTVPTMMSH